MGKGEGVGVGTGVKRAGGVVVCAADGPGGSRLGFRGGGVARSVGLRAPATGVGWAAGLCPRSELTEENTSREVATKATNKMNAPIVLAKFFMLLLRLPAVAFQALHHGAVGSSRPTRPISHQLPSQCLPGRIAAGLSALKVFRCLRSYPPTRTSEEPAVKQESYTRPVTKRLPAGYRAVTRAGWHVGGRPG